MKHYSEKTFMERYPLSRKKPLKKTIFDVIVIMPGILFSYVVLLLLLIPFIQETMNKWTESPLLLESFCGILILVIGVILIYIFEWRYYKTYFYNFTDTLIIIKKGVFAPQEITIPYYRVQDVYVDQDIFDRIFNLYDVHISTATETSGSRAHIDGVEKEVAESLRELILSKIKT